MLLQGLFVPLTCPFYRDGKSYLRKLEHNVRRYSLGPAAGLVALPPGGEAAGLSDVEQQEFLQAVAETAAKQKVLVAGVERGSVYAALERIHLAEGAGFDAVLLAPPAGWDRLIHGSDGSEILLYYQAVADSSPLPVILNLDAGAAALRLPVEAIGALAQMPNILGVVDAALTPERFAALQASTAGVRREVATTTIFEAVTGRMRKAAEVPVAPVLSATQGLVTIGAPEAVAAPPPAAVILKTRTRTVGFQVMAAGPAHAMVPLLKAGVPAVMPPLAAPAPQGCHEVYAAWKDGDERLAEERAQRLRAADLLSDELGVAATKYGCDWNGFYGGPPRLPRVALTADGRSRMEQALGEVRN